MALANEHRQQTDREPVEHTLDVFHTKREGRRAWRVTESRLWRAQKKADDLWRPLQKRRQQGQSLVGQTNKAHAATAEVERVLRETIEIENAWQHVCSALEWFTPEGELDTVEAARAKLELWLPHLQGKAWEKTVRMLQRPESLVFLDRVGKQLQALPFDQAEVQDALRLEAFRRCPSLLTGEDARSGARRAWHMVASLRMARDESFCTVVQQVRNVFRTCWRASSLDCGRENVPISEDTKRTLRVELRTIQNWTCPFAIRLEQHMKTIARILCLSCCCSALAGWLGVAMFREYADYLVPAILLPWRGASSGRLLVPLTRLSSVERLAPRNSPVPAAKRRRE